LVQEVVGSPGRVIPVLYLLHKDGLITVHGQLYEYLLSHRNKSLAWKRNIARAVGLLWDFLQAIEIIALSISPINLHRTIYRQFCEALQFGTINIETKLDPLNLYWPSMNRDRAKLLAGGIDNFVTWVTTEAAGTGKEFDISIVSKLPSGDRNFYPTDSKLATRFLIVAQKIKSLSMLSHLKSVNEMASKYQQQHDQQIFDFGKGETSFDAEPAIYMNPDLVAAFLEYGFVKDPTAEVPEEREDITAKMFFYLLAFGGTRVSEPCHLWYNDIILQSQFTCKVILRHPVLADTFILGERGSRREYLAKLGMLPRNLDECSSAYHAGWKNLKTDKALNAPVFWLHSGAEAEFSALYTRYLVYRRRLMNQRRLCGLNDHPFLFVSAGEDRNAGVSHVGAPYSISAFGSAWDRALERVSKQLGIEIIKSKENGTTEHAPRHFYGQVLADASTNKKIIQSALRHRSVLSQGPYTAPDFKRVDAILSDARKKIETGTGLTLDFASINRVFGTQELLTF
jgi:hypothetical protein